MDDVVWRIRVELMEICIECHKWNIDFSDLIKEIYQRHISSVFRCVFIPGILEVLFVFREWLSFKTTVTIPLTFISPFRVPKVNYLATVRHIEAEFIE